jgi:hypothetical protein
MQGGEVLQVLGQETNLQASTHAQLILVWNKCCFTTKPSSACDAGFHAESGYRLQT